MKKKQPYIFSYLRYLGKCVYYRLLNPIFPAVNLQEKKEPLIYGHQEDPLFILDDTDLLYNGKLINQEENYIQEKFRR
jgi:hypothetical protein